MVGIFLSLILLFYPICTWTQILQVFIVSSRFKSAPQYTKFKITSTFCQDLGGKWGKECHRGALKETANQVPLKPFPWTSERFANLGTVFHPPTELTHVLLIEDLWTCKAHTMSFHWLEGPLLLNILVILSLTLRSSHVVPASFSRLVHYCCSRANLQNCPLNLCFHLWHVIITVPIWGHLPSDHISWWHSVLTGNNAALEGSQRQRLQEQNATSFVLIQEGFARLQWDRAVLQISSEAGRAQEQKKKLWKNWPRWPWVIRKSYKSGLFSGRPPIQHRFDWDGLLHNCAFS